MELIPLFKKIDINYISKRINVKGLTDGLLADASTHGWPLWTDYDVFDIFPLASRDVEKG